MPTRYRRHVADAYLLETGQSQTALPRLSIHELDVSYIFGRRNVAGVEFTAPWQREARLGQARLGGGGGAAVLGLQGGSDVQGAALQTAAGA